MGEGDGLDFVVVDDKSMKMMVLFVSKNNKQIFYFDLVNNLTCEETDFHRTLMSKRTIVKFMLLIKRLSVYCMCIFNGNIIS